jgi:serine/threonine protein phosphatase PrpC
VTTNPPNTHQNETGLSLATEPTQIKEFQGKTFYKLIVFRNYNEDRVAIILNIMKPKAKVFEGQWPKCSFFGVYDGHGGNVCPDFLRDYLH